VAIVVAGQSDIGDGGEFRVIASFLGNVLDVVGERLGVLRRACDGKRVHEAARSIAMVTIIDACGIAREGEFRHAHGLFDAMPDVRLPEHLRAVGADSGTAAGQPRAEGPARHGYMVRVEPLHLSVQIVGQDTFLRCDLQRVGEGFLPLAQDPLPGNFGCDDAVAGFGANPGIQAIFEIIAERAKQRFIRPGMQPPYAVIFVLVFDQAQATLAGFRI
jgi:hypothetical protein